MDKNKRYNLVQRAHSVYWRAEQITWLARKAYNKVTSKDDFTLGKNLQKLIIEGRKHLSELNNHLLDLEKDLINHEKDFEKECEENC